MRRTLILSLTLVAGVGGRDAAAQSAAPPVELGLDVSAPVVPESHGFQWGPRLVVHFDGRNAMQFTTGLQKLSRWEDTAQREIDLYLAAYRRLVHAAGPLRISATLGGGIQRTVIVVPETTFGNPPVTFPSSRGVEVLPAFTTGAAIEFRLGSRAAVVLEPAFVLTDRLGGRVSGGLVVPVGSYNSRPGPLASSVPWAELDPGERAWVTTADGRVVYGEVVGRSAATLTVRTLAGIVSITADDVRAIDTTDPIRNGTIRGATIGSLGGLAWSVWLGLILCTLEADCGGDVLRLGGLLVGIGTGVGAATGALADSLREHRVPLYRRGRSTGVTLAPIIGEHRVGGRAVIRW